MARLQEGGRKEGGRREEGKGCEGGECMMGRREDVGREMWGWGEGGMSGERCGDEEERRRWEGGMRNVGR